MKPYRVSWTRSSSRRAATEHKDFAIEGDAVRYTERLVRLGCFDSVRMRKVSR